MKSRPLARTLVVTAAFGSCVAVWACAHGSRASRAQASRAQAPPPEAPAEPYVPSREDVQVGYATWYGRAFAGRRTASGERFDPGKMTAAHRTLPFGTWVEVRRVDTGETVRVRVTDRGPFGHEDRIIDLSQAAAAKIGLTRSGMARVEVRVVAPPD
jgi:rare lipoprotein A